MKKIILALVLAVGLSGNVYAEEELIYKYAYCSEDYSVVVRGTEKEFKEIK